MKIIKKIILIIAGILFWFVISTIYPNSFTIWVYELVITDVYCYIFFIIGGFIYNLFVDDDNIREALNYE